MAEIQSKSGLARTYDDVSFEYTGSGSPFAAWQLAHFPGGGGNPDAAPGANPDGDVLNNLGEYAHGTDPNVVNGSPISSELVTIGTDQFLRVTIPKNAQATDVTFTIEAAGSLSASWSSAGLVTELETPVLLQVRDVTPVSEGLQRFIRVRAALP